MKKAFLCFIVILFTIIPLFSPSFNFDFINFDDDVFIINNPNVNGGLSLENIQWAFSQSYAGQFQPLTWISHMIDVELYGMDPGKHHLTNVIIHALTCLVLVLTLNNLGVNYIFSLALVLLWGVHPMRLESVVWIAERKDVLSVCFASISFLFYLKFSLLQKKSAYCASVVFYFFALLAKPVVICLPLILMSLDYFILLRRDYRKILFEKIPYFVFMIISAYLTILAQNSDSSLNSLSMIPFNDRVSIVATSYLAYFAKFIWSSGGGVFYPLIDLAPGIGAGAFLGLLALIYIIYSLNKSYLNFGLFWFIVSLLPVIGFIHIGGQQLADRWTYFSHLGIIFGIALLAKEYCYKFSYIIILPILVFAYQTYDRLPNWKNSKSLFEFTLKTYPNNFMAHTNLGVEYDLAGRLDLAVVHFEEAARLNPHYAQALNNLGGLRARQRRFKEAKFLFDKALSLNPNLQAAYDNIDILNSEINLNTAEKLD